MNNKLAVLKARLNLRISVIAGEPVDCTVLSGKNNNGVYITVEIAGNARKAVQNLKSFFGKRFDGAEYDEELNYTYCGLAIENL